MAVEMFFAWDDIPVHCNILHPTREEALRTRKAPLQLGFCSDCGHIYNFAFDESAVAYTSAYENSLHFSPRFQQYAEELASDLIGRHKLSNKTIVEIGCGKGDFLKLLCDRGPNQGFGFDESYHAAAHPRSERFVIIRDSYFGSQARYNADFVCCRHVLEHIGSPLAFAKKIRTAVAHRPDCPVYIEVPNALRTLKDLAIWDIIYEHCSYFTAQSLSMVFTLAGFQILRLEEKYDGQFLGIELLLASQQPSARTKPEGLDELGRFVSNFAKKYRTKVEEWKARLQQFHAAGKRLALWGSGSKGVTFLNILQAFGKIECVVDVNPRKEGMYVAGTGHRIIAPTALRDYTPDIIILTNPIYKEEIAGMLAQLSLHPELLTA